jgi:hypothetical protein
VRKSRFSEEQIIAVLKESEGGWPTQAVFWLEWDRLSTWEWSSFLQYATGSEGRGGWPTQAVFWLEWGRLSTEDWEWSSFLQYATGSEGRVEIECEWAARKRERAAGGHCPAELPHSSQKTA